MDSKEKTFCSKQKRFDIIYSLSIESMNINLESAA